MKRCTLKIGFALTVLGTLVGFPSRAQFIPASASYGPPPIQVGSGLNGFFYNRSADNDAQAESVITRFASDATFLSTRLDYPNGNADTLPDSNTLATFLGADATSLSGFGNTTLEDSVFHFTGFIRIEPSFDTDPTTATIEVKFALGSNDGGHLRIGGVTVVHFDGLRSFGFTSSTAHFEAAGVYPFDLYYYENQSVTGLEVYSSIPGGVNSGGPADTASILPASILYPTNPNPPTQTAYEMNFDTPTGPNGQVLFRGDLLYLATGASPSGGDRNGNSPYLNGFVLQNNDFEPFRPGWGLISHDQRGAGYFLYEGTNNGKSPSYKGTFWRSYTPIPVTPHTLYLFSFYLTNSNQQNPAIVQPSINGLPLSSGVSANGYYTDGIAGHGWQQFTFPWNSGSATTADLSLANLQVTGAGNDFGIDTIALSAVSIPSVLVAGKLTFEKLYSTANLQAVTFTFRFADGSDAFSHTLPIPPTGEFEIKDVPTQSYVLHIKSEHHLAKNIFIDTTNGEVTGVTATLLPGDANNDNSINIFDLAILANDFNTQEGDSNWNEGRSDFNGDHAVNIFDLAILAENFNTDGDL